MNRVFDRVARFGIARVTADSEENFAVSKSEEKNSNRVKQVDLGALSSNDV